MNRVNEAVSFLLELATLAAFAWFGFAGIAGPVLRWVVGLGLPIVTAVFWGAFLAPRAQRRLPIIPGLAMSSALFVAAGVLLIVSGQLVLGVVLLAVVVANRALAFAWKQW